MATLVMASPVLSEVVLSSAENVSSLLFGSITALAGTIGKPIGALQAPPTAAAGGSPWMLISAADDQGPRLPASVKAVRRTNLAETGEKTAYFVVLSSAQVPEATGELQVV